MAKVVLRAQASETIYYDLFVEIDVPEGEFPKHGLAHFSDIYIPDLYDVIGSCDPDLSEHIDDAEDFQIDRVNEVMLPEEVPFWAKDRVLKKLDK